MEATVDCMWRTELIDSHGFCLALQRLPGKELLQQKKKHHGREFTNPKMPINTVMKLQYDRFGSVQGL